jgi:hypothetical protein
MTATFNGECPKTVTSRSSDDETEASTALVLYRPVLEELLRPARNRLLRLELVFLVTLIGFGYFAWKTLAREQVAGETNLLQNRSLLSLTASIGDEQAQLHKLTRSLDGMTTSVAQSTSRMNDLSTKLELVGSEVDRSKSEVHGIEAILRNRQTINPQVTGIRAVAPGGPSRPVSVQASVSNPHIHQVDTTIPIPNGSLAHQDRQGEIDYWMVPRMFPNGERFVKVQPYGTISLGIQLHSIDDGMDYILTPQGGWLDALGDR